MKLTKEQLKVLYAAVYETGNIQPSEVVDALTDAQIKLSEISWEETCKKIKEEIDDVLPPM